MRTRRFSAVLAALSVPLLAGGAFAVANSVSTTPGPQVILPARTSSETPVRARSSHHGAPATTMATTSDDPAGHDGATTTTTGHDVGDDHGHDGTTSTTTATDTTTTTTTTTTDDHGGPGRGTDDGSGHNAANDHGGNG